MKKLLILLAFVSLTAQAQLGGIGETQIYNTVGYAASTVDTSATYTIGGLNQLQLRMYHSDSVNVVYKFDYRVLGNTAWTAVSAAVGDTISVTSGSAGYEDVILRNNTTERIPGVATQFRVRADFQATNNSANSGATHNGWLQYR